LEGEVYGESASKPTYIITKQGTDIKSANLVKLALINFMVETGES